MTATIHELVHMFSLAIVRTQKLTRHDVSEAGAAFAFESIWFPVLNDHAIQLLALLQVADERLTPEERDALQRTRTSHVPSPAGGNPAANNQDQTGRTRTHGVGPVRVEVETVESPGAISGRHGASLSNEDEDAIVSFEHECPSYGFLDLDCTD